MVLSVRLVLALNAVNVKPTITVNKRNFDYSSSKKLLNFAWFVEMRLTTETFARTTWGRHSDETFHYRHDRRRSADARQ